MTRPKNPTDLVIALLITCACCMMLFLPMYLSHSHHKDWKECRDLGRNLEIIRSDDAFVRASRIDGECYVTVLFAGSRTNVPIEKIEAAWKARKHD